MDWQTLTIEQWRSLQIEDWGQVFFVDTEPMFPSVSLESLGFSQDNDFVYLPLESLGLPLRWSQLTVTQWQTLTTEQWQAMSEQDYSDQQLFWLLLLKLQAAQLPAHQFRIMGNLAVVESRAWLVSEFINPDNY